MPEHSSRSSEERTPAPYSDASDAGITAVEMARLARVTPADIHYWGKSGYLEKRPGGSSAFPLSQVPKAQLMGIFAKQLCMDTGEASRLAEQLLPLYEQKPDIVTALRTLATAVQSRIGALAEVLVDSGVVSTIDQLLQTEPSEEGP